MFLLPCWDFCGFICSRMANRGCQTYSNTFGSFLELSQKRPNIDLSTSFLCRSTSKYTRSIMGTYLKIVFSYHDISKKQNFQNVGNNKQLNSIITCCVCQNLVVHKQSASARAFQQKHRILRWWNLESENLKLKHKKFRKSESLQA